MKKEDLRAFLYDDGKMPKWQQILIALALLGTLWLSLE